LTRSGKEIAAEFGAASTSFIAAVEAFPEDRWHETCPDEGWSYAVTAHHVASGFEVASGFVQAVAAGEVLPELTWDDVNAQNAAHAMRMARVTKSEVLAALRELRALAIAAVSPLTREQLGRRGNPIPLFGGQSLMATEIADMLLVKHPAMHTTGMNAVAFRSRLQP
jgi:hypothetical protein